MSQPQTRMTRQRMVILEELRKVKTHPTADELYAMVRTRMPRISLGTVYRNLDFLTESKEIRLHPPFRRRYPPSSACALPGLRQNRGCHSSRADAFR